MRSLPAFRLLVDTLFPAGPCILCGADSRCGPVPGVCRSCWRKRRRPSAPDCPVCGMPLPPVEGQEAHACGACLADPPAYAAHASAYVYAGPVRAAVLLYKDQRRYPLAGVLGVALARRVRRAWPECDWDAVVYVPGPWRRRMARGFEPAGLVAEAAARHLGLPCRRWLIPLKSPEPQKGLSAAGRRRNLQGAFGASRALLEGKRILLVDDIRTTGATLREASKVLIRAGAERVHAATVALVLTRELDMMDASKEPDEPRWRWGDGG